MSVCEYVNVSGECVCCVNVSVHMYVNGERVYVSASVCECVRCVVCVGHMDLSNKNLWLYFSCFFKVEPLISWDPAEGKGFC